MADNGCTWCEGECSFHESAYKLWEQKVQAAIRQYQDTGRKCFVRGFRKGISHEGAWAYGHYIEPFPELDSRDWSEYGLRFKAWQLAASAESRSYARVKVWSAILNWNLHRAGS